MEPPPTSQLQRRETSNTSKKVTTQIAEDTTQSHVLYSILCRDEKASRSKQYSLPDNPFENAKPDGPETPKTHIAIEVVVEAIGTGSASDWQSDAAITKPQEKEKKSKRYFSDSDDSGSGSDSPLAKARNAAIEKERKEIGVEYTDDIGPVREKNFGSFQPKTVVVKSIRIRSENLRNLFRAFIQFYPAHIMTGDTIVSDSPFKMLAHYYHDLVAIRDGNTNILSEQLLRQAYAALNPPVRECTIDEATIQDLGVLLNYFNRIWTNNFAPEYKKFESGYTSYSHLWQLFRPGDTVYARVGGKLTAYVFSTGLERSETEKMRGGSHWWTANCWALRYNGRRIVRSASTFTIYSFLGYREILSLPVFPAIYKDRLDGGRTRAQLTELGKKYYQIVRESPAHKRYEGLCWDLERAKNFRTTARWQKRKPDSEYKGEIMIDHRKKRVHRKGDHQPEVEYNMRQPIDIDPDEGLSESEDEEGTGEGDKKDPSKGDGPLVNFDTFSPKNREVLTDQHYLLFPRRMIGFALAQKQKMEFDVEYIKPIDWPPRDKDPMNALILEDSDKKVLQALTRKYARGEESWGADYTEGKGEGSIFLFHGPPGTGKTFTVECVARYTRRPLLRLTVADIGTNERIMEQILGEWFQRGTDWGAIILIDEADVFLEKRQVKDLQRNSLVSVFLSCMEYYAGMLFLTTNRIGHIDDAFLSRISVALTYKTLDIGKQKRIWDGFLKKLADERKDIILTDRAKKFTERLDQDPTLKDVPWNGREIRNALQIAIALATHEAEEIAEETGTRARIVVEPHHFQAVVDRRKEFVEYRTSIHRRDEEARAVADGARAKSK